MEPRWTDKSICYAFKHNASLIIMPGLIQTCPKAVSLMCSIHCSIHACCNFSLVIEAGLFLLIKKKTSYFWKHFLLNETLLATLVSCSLCAYLYWEALLEEYKSLPGPWMAMTAMSWQGGQRWAEPTKMSDFLVLPLTTQLETKKEKENIARNLRGYNKNRQNLLLV